jgi:hypothetical protein
VSESLGGVVCRRARPQRREGEKGFRFSGCVAAEAIRFQDQRLYGSRHVEKVVR